MFITLFDGPLTECLHVSSMRGAHALPDRSDPLAGL